MHIIVEASVFPSLILFPSVIFVSCWTHILYYLIFSSVLALILIPAEGQLSATQKNPNCSDVFKGYILRRLIW